MKTRELTANEKSLRRADKIGLIWLTFWFIVVAIGLMAGACTPYLCPAYR